MGATSYNIIEVFELAEQIERNGSAFYNEAAKAAGGELRELLLSLAQMEDQHEVLFSRLKTQAKLNHPERALAVDPEDEGLAYLRAAAGAHIFSSAKDPLLLAREARGPVDVLTMAIQVEKDTVALFMGLRDAMPQEWGRGEVQSILEEEKRHVVMLSRALQKVLDT